MISDPLQAGLEDEESRIGRALVVGVFLSLMLWCLLAYVGAWAVGMGS